MDNDAAAYREFLSILDGTAGRQRARDQVRPDALERRRELTRWSDEVGTPLPPNVDRLEASDPRREQHDPEALEREQLQERWQRLRESG